MKKIGAAQVAATYAGCFLGAGCVSGQELRQFLGSYGIHGFYGAALAVALQFVFGVMFLSLARRTKISRMDRLIVMPEIGWLRDLVGAVASLFLFAVVTVMSAGFGAMLHQLLGIPSFVGSLFLCGAAALCAIAGVQGMVAAFSLTVPILTLGAIAIAVWALARWGIHVPAAEPHGRLLGGWAVAACTFLAYNVFGSVGILAPVGQFIKSRRSLIFGVAISCLAIAVIITGLLLAMAACPASNGAELPMLAVASTLSPVCGGVYAVLLFFGMFGTSLSCLVALESYLTQKFIVLLKPRKILIAACAAAAFAGSLGGFSKLIAILYPLFGYFGIASLIGIAIHYFVTVFGKKEKKNEAQNAG